MLRDLFSVRWECIWASDYVLDARTQLVYTSLEEGWKVSQLPSDY